jgi:hypothetical protein
VSTIQTSNVRASRTLATALSLAAAAAFVGSPLLLSGCDKTETTQQKTTTTKTDTPSGTTKTTETTEKKTEIDPK